MSLFSDIYTQSHEDNRIFVSAFETDLHRLPATVPRLFVIVDVYHRIRPPAGAGLESRIATHDFLHPFETFASAEAANPAVQAMLTSIQLPFRLHAGQLRWRESSGDDDVDVTDDASVALDGVDGVVARVSEVGARIVAVGARSHAPVEMRVTIRKVTVVSVETFAAMFERSDDNDDDYLLPNDLWNLRLGVGRRAPAGMEGYGMRLDVDYENEGIDASQIAMYFDMPEGLGAAALALETERYEGDGDEGSKLTCPICIDDVAIGSKVNRLPCSHRFHGDCMAKWLLKSRTCPLCRLNL